MLTLGVLFLALALAVGCSSDEDEPTAAAAPASATAAATSAYWQPTTDFYGAPVYGGHLRINYEDPLEHANLWALTAASP